MKQNAVTRINGGIDFKFEVYFDPHNKRVRIDDFQGNAEKVIRYAEEAAKSISAEKVIFKVRHEQFTEFLKFGYCCEAKLDGYFLGSDMYFFSKYFSEHRRKNELWISEDQILDKIYQLEQQVKEKQIPKDVILRKAGIEDAKALSNLYKNVFKVYPTAVHDSDYISKTINEGTIYYVFEQNGSIVSAASAEVNQFYKNAELTDCATLDSYRKHGFVKHLLQKLEADLKKNGIFCVYSLARAQSFGMNAAFYQLGYQYRGRLLNNCLIFAELENMNLWVKDLSISH